MQVRATGIGSSDEAASPAERMERHGRVESVGMCVKVVEALMGRTCGEAAGSRHRRGTNAVWGMQRATEAADACHQ